MLDLGTLILILGAPRSGTTFLGSCIGALAEVSYHFEPRVTKAAARQVYERLFNADVPTAIGGVRVELDDGREKMQKKIRHGDTEAQRFSGFLDLVSPCVCASVVGFVSRNRDITRVDRVPRDDEV